MFIDMVVSLGNKSFWATQESSYQLIFTLGDLGIFGLLEILTIKFWTNNKFCCLLSLFLFIQKFINCYISYVNMIPESTFLFYRQCSFNIRKLGQLWPLGTALSQT